MINYPILTAITVMTSFAYNFKPINILFYDIL